LLLAERETLRLELKNLTRANEELREKMTRLAQEASAMAAERDLLGRELADARSDGARHDATAREEAELRVRLGEEHAATVAALTRRLSELEEADSGRRALEARLLELEHQALRASELERKVQSLEARLAAQAELEVRNVELEARLLLQAELERQNAELEQKLRDAEQRPAQAVEAPRAPSGDDLTRLKGIGPGLEKALRGAGVTTLAQIAAWTDADIRAIAPMLRARPERIQREDWVGNARRLLQGS
jgi:predicted flap endonuclease-1-like 5' DNA nuclease